MDNKDAGNGTPEELTEEKVIYLAGLTPLQKLQEIRKAAKQHKVPVRDLAKLVKDKERASKTAEQVVNEALAVSAKQADQLIAIAKESAKFFHTPAPDRDAFAYLRVGDHYETMRVRGEFRKWLRNAYFERNKLGCNSEALQTAVETLACMAEFSGEEAEVSIRVAGHGGAIYIDLGDASWRAIEVTAKGWNIIATAPVHFRRTSSTGALPVPQRGGEVKAFRKFVNVRSEDDFVLLISVILAALRPRAAYPVTVIVGQHGSAKTWLERLIVRLVDPREPELRSAPREEDQLVVQAKSAHLLPYDNISHLSSEMSDAFCRLSTGGGQSKRKLFTDDDEVLFSGTRPIVTNGITDFVTRPDLLDRSVILACEPIPEAKRREEKHLNAEFAREAPGIFGALLDGLVAGLRSADEIPLKDLPRMADFARWSEACCRAWWEPKTFLKAYRDNRAEAVELSIEANPVATAVRGLMANRTLWSGTAETLLELLTAAVSERTARSRGWPSLPHLLGGQLRRAAPNLLRVGIQVEWSEGHHYGRVITITTTKKAGEAETDQHCKPASPASRNGGSTASENSIGDARDARDAHLQKQSEPVRVGFFDCPEDEPTELREPEPTCARCGIAGNHFHGQLIRAGQDGNAGHYHPRCWTEERTRGPRRVPSDRRPALGPSGDTLDDFK
jgi:hypothetical protein